MKRVICFMLATLMIVGFTQTGVADSTLTYVQSPYYLTGNNYTPEWADSDVMRGCLAILCAVEFVGNEPNFDGSIDFNAGVCVAHMKGSVSNYLVTILTIANGDRVIFFYDPDGVYYGLSTGTYDDTLNWLKSEGGVIDYWVVSPNGIAEGYERITSVLGITLDN